MLPRTLFSNEHDIFRDNVRRFIETEMVPHHRQWELDGVVPRELWRKAGEQGLLCVNVPEEYGGIGAEWYYNVVVIEELARAGVSGPGSGFMVHSEMVASYLLSFGSEALKRKYLPRMVTGEFIGAIAMTEPGAGSDLKSLRTTAVRQGDEYLINGQKIYISNGFNADIIIVATKTDPAAGARGVSLIVIETDQPGFKRGRMLEKIGLQAQDTAELFFEDVRAPVENLLGAEGAGFTMLMTKLAQERLVQAIRSCSAIEAILEWTIAYARERKIFDKPLAEFQNTQFKLAELSAEAAGLRTFVDRSIAAFFDGTLTGVDAAKVKLVASNLHCRVADECLQFFGGYGYVFEFPIARAFVDARVAKIAGGTVEVMKHIIGRDLFA
ncbi:acyl-CoA dehydrogenase family protein [Sphingobium sp. EM0848]|uniref:acyl-CoA dehydrogenase family protein n=1 Tax=Sphingobium sp. EM0848 TaxID=2743473 RepID=UPI00159C682E|nr:acyl-CoA dehydrogenase family protein [Sphingobium sp. EM0848]